MKKQITIGIGIIACIALCAAVWPRSSEVGDLHTESAKTAVTAEIEAPSEKSPQIFLSAYTPAPQAEPISESELSKTDITAEEKTEPLAPRTASKSVPASTEPKSGDKAVIDGKPHVWIPGFGWIVDEGGAAASARQSAILVTSSPATRSV